MLYKVECSFLTFDDLINHIDHELFPGVQSFTSGFRGPLAIAIADYFSQGGSAYVSSSGIAHGCLINGQDFLNIVLDAMFIYCTADHQLTREDIVEVLPEEFDTIYSRVLVYGRVINHAAA